MKLSKSKFQVLHIIIPVFLLSCNFSDTPIVSDGIVFEKIDMAEIDWNAFVVKQSDSVDFNIIYKGLNTYNTLGNSAVVTGSDLPDIYQLDHLTLKVMANAIRVNNWDKSATEVRISKVVSADTVLYSITLEFNLNCGNLCGYRFKRTRVIYSLSGTIIRIIDKFKKTDLIAI